MAFELRRRQIHLDFHTGPAVPDVGAEFDPDAFADAFARAHVDSVTIFAKGHHGHLYYDTGRPERHPGLKPGLDLLGEQIEALHRRDIRAPVYLSVQCDEYAANTRPEWIAINPNGSRVAPPPFVPGWQIMDMSSPYQDYLAEQIAEVLEKYAPLDGLFLDMCWDQVSASRWAIDAMRARGMNPQDEADRGRYARRLAHEYMSRYKKMFDDAHKGARPAGIWFNSRPKANLLEERKFVRHIEIEALPTGGWGYAYFPYAARLVRPLGLPTLAMTGRFHRSWGDFGGLKPEAALKYECCLALSQGMAGSVGDQLHPRGLPDKATYDLIGRVYDHVARCEPWTEGGRILSEVGVVIDPTQGDTGGDCGLGIIRALQQLRLQFDLLGPDATLKDYPLVIVPESAPVSDALLKSLRQYIADGGAAVFSGDAAFEPDGKPVLEELGIVAHGESPYSTTYLRPARAIARGIAEADHVLYERTRRITPARGAKLLCKVVEPYFERAWDHFVSHGQTPPDKASRYAAVVQNGRVITFAMPVFTAYGRFGNIPYRQILGNCIDLLLPEPLIRDEGPSHLETTVVRKGARTVVHLLSYCPVRRTPHLDIVEEATPLVDVPISVRLEREPTRALLVTPEETPLDFEYRDGYVSTRVTLTTGHGMLVFE